MSRRRKSGHYPVVVCLHRHCHRHHRTRVGDCDASAIQSIGGHCSRRRSETGDSNSSFHSCRPLLRLRQSSSSGSSFQLRGLEVVDCGNLVGCLLLLLLWLLSAPSTECHHSRRSTAVDSRRYVYNIVRAIYSDVRQS